MNNLIKTLAIILVLLAPVASAAGHDDDIATVITHGRSSLSLQQVINIVDEEAKGQVTEVHFERMDGALVYQVEAITPKGVMEYMVDPSDGKIISFSKDRWSFFKDIKNTGKLKVTLEQAVTKAEQATKGKCVSAELEEEDGIAVYQLRMVVDRSIREILVDPNNGKIYYDDHGEREGDE